MTDEIIYSQNRRQPWIAVMLSFVVPGLGHLYCGKIVRGLVLTFILAILSNLIWASIVLFSPLKTYVFGMLLIMLSVLSLTLAIDCYLIARRTKLDYELKDYNRAVVYIIWVVMITFSTFTGMLYFRAKFLEVFIVPSASCYPTIVPGDRVLANKTIYRESNPQRGDNVIFLSPENRHIKNIKRVVALAGDTLEIKDGELYINDQKLQRNKLPDSELDKIRIKVDGTLLEGDLYQEINGDAVYNIFMTQAVKPDFEKITVPENHCFVLGDNRNNSHDSRDYGPVPLAALIGRADFLCWPSKVISRFGSLN